MTTVLLVRHAEAHSIHDRLLGWTAGIHLNPRGREQAELVSKWIKQWTPDAIYSSPLERCVETAQVIAGRLGKTIYTNDALGEIQFGDWTGKSYHELDQRPEWHRYNSLRSLMRPPGGESASDAQMRMTREIARIAGGHNGNTIVAVSHGDPIKAAIALYLGIPIDLFHRIEIGTASVSAISFEPDAPRVLMVGAPMGG